MGNVRTRKETGCLFLDFRYKGVRCREQTLLTDSPSNRRRLTEMLKRIEREIQQGVFDYARHFPDSPVARRFASEPVSEAGSGGQAGAAVPVVTPALPASPTTPGFGEFAEQWFAEMAPQWRTSHRETVRSTMDKYLLPTFAPKSLESISKADILAFRASLASRRTRNGRPISASRINHVITPLRMIMNEASDRYGFHTPFRAIKAIKVPKSDVEPFTLEEVQMILDNVRADYRNYYAIRFFTGMRTAEVDGLKWRFVDFERRQILVREAFVNGEVTYTKNDGSQREIRMSAPVYEALMAQHEVTGQGEYVFCTRQGTPLSHRNVTLRVWYPLLRHLGLRSRRPYQTRHTAATLWLAAGESPEWIARQLGHTTTEMLFRVYSRYVPNLTRQDGTAFDRLISSVTRTA